MKNTEVTTLDYEDSYIYNKYFNTFLLLLLSLAVSNLFGRGTYVLMFLVISYILLKFDTIRINRSFIILLLFSLSYFLFDIGNNNNPLSNIKILILPLLWLIIFNESKGKKIDEIFRLIIFLCFGMAAHGLMNFMYNYTLGTQMMSGISYDFWTQSFSSATGQAMNFTLFIAWSFWLILLQEKVTIKMLSIFIFICSLLYNIQLGGRTFLVLAIISIVIGVLSSVFFSIGDMKVKKMMTILLLIIGITILGIYLFNRDAFGIRSWYENSYLYIRFTEHNAIVLTNNSRFDRKFNYIRLLPKYLWGGNHISSTEGIGYAHDLWLDIYDDAGVFPFIFIILYTISLSKRNFIIIRESNISIEYKIGVLVYTIVILAQFFTEPILAGAPLLLSSVVMIDGAFASYINQLSSKYYKN